ncbi:unnamed protein product [Allacma fusca]|uniref:Uncharacterized protein n=1 Tax=Allacma fusca TaxID=39272 RepID=A0A8J2KH51_9HEXA|nr:unnamed protein product [Allacma fusca]
MTLCPAEWTGEMAICKEVVQPNDIVFIPNGKNLVKKISVYNNRTKNRSRKRSRGRKCFGRGASTQGNKLRAITASVPGTSTSRNREEPTLKTTDKKDSLEKSKSNYKKSVESSQETRGPVSKGTGEKSTSISAHCSKTTVVSGSDLGATKSKSLHGGANKQTKIEGFLKSTVKGKCGENTSGSSKKTISTHTSIAPTDVLEGKRSNQDVEAGQKSKKKKSDAVAVENTVAPQALDNQDVLGDVIHGSGLESFNTVDIDMLDMLVTEVLAKLSPKGSSTTKEAAEDGKEEQGASSEVAPDIDAQMQNQTVGKEKTVFCYQLEEEEDVFFPCSPGGTRYEVDPFKAWDLDLPILIKEEKEDN